MNESMDQRMDEGYVDFGHHTVLLESFHLVVARALPPGSKYSAEGIQSAALPIPSSDA